MEGSARTPTHLWIVGGLSALWNALGAYDYVMTQTGNTDYLAGFSEAQKIYFERFPAWADAAWALGVWGALAGSLLLLLRSRHALSAFGLSLAGLVVGTLYRAATPTPAGMDDILMTGMTIAIWVIAFALLFYAYQMRAKAVLR